MGKALIIAAGRGSRLLQDEDDRPKPLTKVVGLTLIERTILSAKKSGIEEFVIVVGYRGEEIQAYLQKKSARLGVKLSFVWNKEWEKPNGFSVLAAESVLAATGGDFVLLMSDHIFDPQIITKLIDEKKEKKKDTDDVLLAVDTKLDQIFDMDDATKVKSQNSYPVSIGKELKDYNEIDTGVFLCSPKIFAALKTACQTGTGSLSEAIQILAKEKRVRTVNIGESYWQDVDTPQSHDHAEKILFQATRKKTDGFISKNLNRHVSSFISRFLVRLPIGPNPITWSALVLGLLSGYMLSRGTYASVVIGGLLFQFTSIYDGCDGEVAKLKFASTKFGEWLDTVCDNITYIAFTIGLIVGLQNQGYPFIGLLGLVTIFGVLMTLGVMYAYLWKYTSSGSLVTVQKVIFDGLLSHKQNFFVSSVTKMKFMMKRDFFALFFMTLCLLNRMDVIIWFTALGTNITWIVFLTMNRPYPTVETHDVEANALQRH